MAGDRAFGVTVTYQRATITVELTATAQNVRYETDSQDGFPIVVHMREFVIAVDAIVLGGSIREPREGDRVVETINGTATTFVVTKAGNQRACELLPGGYRWKIRTVQDKR